MMTHNQEIQRSCWAGGLVIIVAAILYGFTLDNGLRPDELTGGDLITHQYAQVEARPSNAPGYPLYTMGGWLWFRIGRVLLGWLLNPIPILSAYSTLWGLLSLLILYWILLNVSETRWWLATLLTLFYATTFFFWFYSVTTEQYTSAVFQTLLLIWLAFKWDDQPRPATLLWLAFISGTMLANMVTTLFILPPLLWFILSRPPDDGDAGPMLLSYLKQPALILKIVGVTLLPLLSYAFIYIRGAQHPEWRGAGQWPSTWAWFIQFLTIQQGRDELAPGLAVAPVFTAEFPVLMWHELTWPIFFGGLLGIAALGRRRAIFLYATLVIYFGFSWGYRFGNWFQVIIPAYPLFIIGTAAGLTYLDKRFLSHSHFTSDQGSTTMSQFTNPLLTSIALLALIVFRLITNLPRADQQTLPTDTGLDPGWAILADQPAVPAVIAVNFEEEVALQYLTTVWRATPNIFPVAPDQFEGYQPDLGREAAINRYVSRAAVAAAPALVQQGHPQAAGAQLIALWPLPRTEAPSEIRAIEQPFGEQLTLIGWEHVTHPSLWQIALYWQASATLPADYTVSARPLVAGQLIRANGEPLIQDHQPVWGVYPTSRWQPGEIVRDVYTLGLPKGVKPDAFQVVVYQAVDGKFENIGEVTLGLIP